MDGFDSTTYGERFADVYDDWYHDVSDVASTVTTLIDLALIDLALIDLALIDLALTDLALTETDGSGRILELGVGTGRLAIPLAEAGSEHSLRVVGVDSSRAMLARLTERDVGGLVTAIEADMVHGLPDGPFQLAFVAYNTIFNLTDPADQAACFSAVAERLVTGGRFVIEAFIPDDPAPNGDTITLRSMTTDRVVLSISRHDADGQTATGQFVEFTESGGVRLRPWSIRYATPEQLDAMASTAGFEVEQRWEAFDRSTFCADSPRHVTVYRKV